MNDHFCQSACFPIPVFFLNARRVRKRQPCILNILREKSLAIYFGDSQFKRNRTFNFIVSKIYVEKCSRVPCHKQIDISHNVKSDLMPPC